MNKNTISRVVALTLSTGVTFGVTETFAAEDSAADDQKITITGSRIKRVDMEGATPVTVITAEDIDADD